MGEQSLGLKPEALLFDAYGTLFDVDSVTAACEELCPGRGRELSAVWRRKQLEYSWLLNQMERFEDFWQVTGKALAFALKALALPADAGVKERLMQQYLHLKTFADARETLASLSGYPRYILSNGSAKMLQTLVENAGIQDYLMDIISVDAVRKFKPSPEVYRLAVNKAGKVPEAVGLVSGNAWDASGAKSAGLLAYWVDRGVGPCEELGFAPDAKVNQLAQLATIL